MPFLGSILKISKAIFLKNWRNAPIERIWRRNLWDRWPRGVEKYFLTLHKTRLVMAFFYLRDVCFSAQFSLNNKGDRLTFDNKSMADTTKSLQMRSSRLFFWNISRDMMEMPPWYIFRCRPPRGKTDVEVICISATLFIFLLYSSTVREKNSKITI